MKKFLKYGSKLILFYSVTDTRTKYNSSATQPRLQYKTGVAMQDNAAQHWWYSNTGVEHNFKYW